MRISDWSSDVCSSDLMSDAAINRSFDFVLTNPGHYVNLELSVGASRIATIAQGRHSINSLSLGSAVIAKADRGDLIDMQDLKGQIMVATTHEGFGGYQTVWRSEERRVGNRCVSTFRSRWTPDN